ncbi:unnamed protein product [Polarella glacialis]|uniref:Uncharacterized protein n=1 Tax=Polarella glacialis TaxID=89957 RepID=A0A813FPJ3_POLGL|nr:unnamed protein product [Polarella glacialis]
MALCCRALTASQRLGPVLTLTSRSAVMQIRPHCSKWSSWETLRCQRVASISPADESFTRHDNSDSSDSPSRFASRYVAHGNPTFKVFDSSQLEHLIQEARLPRRRQPRSKPRRQNDAGEWPCNACTRLLPPHEFYLDAKTRRSTWCKDCTRTKTYEYARTLRGNAARLAASAMYRSRQRKIRCSLTQDDILEMMWEQKGCCAYSGVSMEMLVPNSHWRMSLERKDNESGYSRENSVLVVAEFNTPDYSRSPGVRKSEVLGTAQWSAAKVQHVFRARQVNEDLLQLAEDIRQAREKPGCSRSSSLKQQTDADGKWQCVACGQYKYMTGFHSHAGKVNGIRSDCKQCCRDSSMRHRSTLRGHVQTILSHVRARSNTRQLLTDLDLNSIIDMLWLQRGRCFYSGIPLQYKALHVHWRMSLERVNNSVGYTKENCVLIAVEFNTSDYSRNKATTQVFGTAQWSREKVIHVWGPAFCETLQIS